MTLPADVIVIAMMVEKNANRVSNGSFYFDQLYNKTNSDWRHRSMVRFISLGCGNIAHMPLALGRYSRNLGK